MTAISFDGRAARYDELRPVDEHWWTSFDAIVRAGALRGTRVLDVGCGTGRFAHALAERAEARVSAVDASAEMVERARALGVDARVARGEALPFARGSFDAATLRMVAHLVDRPRVFGELERVLAPGGRAVVATEDPASFEEVWFARFFPSVPELERARFPSEEALRAELARAGFATVRAHRLPLTRTMAREHALEVIRTRIYSTFDLLEPDEYADGLARAERELPPHVDAPFAWLVVTATR